MAFCTSCGSELPANTKFCTACGAGAGGGEEAAPGGEARPVPVTAAAPAAPFPEPVPVPAPMSAAPAPVQTVPRPQPAPAARIHTSRRYGAAQGQPVCGDQHGGLFRHYPALLSPADWFDFLHCVRLRRYQKPEQAEPGKGVSDLYDHRPGALRDPRGAGTGHGELAAGAVPGGMERCPRRGGGRHRRLYRQLDGPAAPGGRRRDGPDPYALTDTTSNNI